MSVVAVEATEVVAAGLGERRQAEGRARASAMTGYTKVGLLIYIVVIHQTNKRTVAYLGVDIF